LDSPFAVALDIISSAMSISLSFNATMLRTLLLLIFSLAIEAEIREFNGLIDADSSFIHYSEGFIIAPGYIDLSELTFTTTAGGEDDGYDPEMRDPSDETAGDSETDDDTMIPGDADTNPNKDGGGRRLTLDSTVGAYAMESPLRHAVR
jgi:hypothetical protein